MHLATANCERRPATHTKWISPDYANSLSQTVALSTNRRWSTLNQLLMETV